MTPLRIKVRYFGSIYQRLGKKEEYISMRSSPFVGEVLKNIIEMYGEPSRELFYLNKGTGKLGILITRNRKLVGKEERLEEGDEIALIPMVSGG